MPKQTAAPNVLLMGLRGSGKTTIGRALAARLGWPFIDLDDDALCRFAEPTVRAVWHTHGEQAWREAEFETLREVTQISGQVIALGGGTPCIEEARVLIESQRAAGWAVVIYLRADPQLLRTRLQTETGDRPPLTAAGDASAEIEEVLARRSPIYEGLADLIIDLDDASPEELATRITAALAQRIPDFASGKPGQSCFLKRAATVRERGSRSPQKPPPDSRGSSGKPEQPEDQ